MSGLKGPAAVAIMLALLLAVLGETAPTRAETQRYTGTIAFLRWSPGAAYSSTWPSLYAVRADGGGLRRLTPEGTSVLTYRWSPDGRLIAYLDQHRSLWLVRPDGTGRRVLLANSKASNVWGLSWSPDSKDIAIFSPEPEASLRIAGRPNALYVVPTDGAAPARLTGGRHLGCDVAWSPRGDEIAYDDCGGGIWVIRPDGTDRRQISEGGGARWSSDGAQLAFNVVIHLRNGMTNRYSAFAVVNADGTHYHVVTTHAYTEYGQSWSPFGWRILYGRADRKGIYMIGADGRNNRRVTRDSPPRTAWPALAWSPNGGSIVYDTDRTGDGDLYLIGVDGRSRLQLTSTPDTDVAPTWVAR